MKKYKFVVLTNPTEGHEEEYNDWYTGKHLPDVVSIPGIVTAQRFKPSMILAGDPSWKYLAIYEVETDDPEAVVAELNARANTEKMPLSETLHMDSILAVIFEPITDVVRQV